MLAGLSVEYYARLERGSLRGVSEAVLESLSRALRLDEAERAHLFDLARAGNAGGGSRRAAVPQQVRPGVQRILDSMTAAGAGQQRPDGLPGRQPARPGAVRAAVRLPGRPVNAARFLLLDPRGPDFYPDWDQAVDDAVAMLRSRGRPQPLRQGAHRPHR